MNLFESSETFFGMSFDMSYYENQLDDGDRTVYLDSDGDMTDEIRLGDMNIPDDTLISAYVNPLGNVTIRFRLPLQEEEE